MMDAKIRILHIWASNHHEHRKFADATKLWGFRNLTWWHDKLIFTVCTLSTYISCVGRALVTLKRVHSGLTCKVRITVLSCTVYVQSWNHLLCFYTHILYSLDLTHYQLVNVKPFIAFSGFSLVKRQIKIKWKLLAGISPWVNTTFHYIYHRLRFQSPN